MARITPATLALDKNCVSFALRSYDYDPGADKVGLQAAAALGADPGRVLKTLMTLVDEKPVCVILPSDREVAMKKLASALGGKTARMMAPADAERLTGYKVGGISPLGQRKGSRTAIEASVMRLTLVFVNGGQRGLQIELAPTDLAAAAQAMVADLIA